MILYLREALSRDSEENRRDAQYREDEVHACQKLFSCFRVRSSLAKGENHATEAQKQESSYRTRDCELAWQNVGRAEP